MTGREPKPTYDQEPTDNQVAITTLDDPPVRGIDRGLVHVFTRKGRKIKSNYEPDWMPRDFYDEAEMDERCHYVPMNSCGTVEVKAGEYGYLGTSKLNGCTAVAAAYHDGDDVVHNFLAHYDAESVREADKDGHLKLSNLLAGFVSGAGDQPVRVAVAYNDLVRSQPGYGADDYQREDFPDRAIVDTCKEVLPDGSSVLEIPYKTSSDADDPIIGHVLAVGRGAADMIDFDWNGRSIEVGKPEVVVDERRLRVARATAALAAERSVNIGGDDQFSDLS